jgi:cytochrome c oxidase subunit II
MAFKTLQKVGVALPLTLWSLIVHADLRWNFPKPVTPMAEDTLHVHNKFMVIIMVIFLVVLGIAQAHGLRCSGRWCHLPYFYISTSF